MLKHLWFECSYVIWPNPKNLLFFIRFINNEAIMTLMLAAGIVSCAFA